MQIGFNRKAEQKPRPWAPFFSQANDTPTPMTADRCRFTAAHEIVTEGCVAVGGKRTVITLRGSSLCLGQIGMVLAWPIGIIL
jgi:hypothetical protein